MLCVWYIYSISWSTFTPLSIKPTESLFENITVVKLLTCSIIDVIISLDLLIIEWYKPGLYRTE